MYGLTKLTAGVLLAMAAGQAMAVEDSVDVKVTGQIVPPACVPAVSGGAVFDLGTIKAATLAKDDYTLLAKKDLTLTVTCDSPMKVAFSGIDARAGTAVPPVGKGLISSGATVTEGDSSVMGLGTTTEGKNIGGYKMAFLTNEINFTLDGVKADTTPIRSEDGGSTWNAYGCPNCAWISPQSTNTFTSFAAQGTTEPLAFTTMSSKLRVQAAINKGSELDLTKVINIDGLMSIQLTYL